MVRNKKLKTLVDFLKEKKTSSLKVLDISKISIIADFFVIVSVPSQKNVEALDTEICDLMEKNGYELRNKEGMRSPWILLDYNDVIIHIFDDETRKFYDIEKIWADAKEVNLD